MAGAPRFTGAAMARALSHALERPVVHRDPPPAVYRSFGLHGRGRPGQLQMAAIDDLDDDLQKLR
jgi:hypothetical protein